MRLSIRLQQDSFDPGAETNAFLQEAKGAGAAVTFTGLVRSTPDAPIDSLTLEHYPALAEAQLRRIGEQAMCPLRSSRPHGHPPLRQAAA